MSLKYEPASERQVSAECVADRSQLHRYRGNLLVESVPPTALCREQVICVFTKSLN